MIAKIVTQRFVKCGAPDCDQMQRVPEENFKRWNCQECGRCWATKPGAEPDTFDLEELVDERHVPTTVFVRLATPIILALADWEYPHTRRLTDAERHTHSAYYYETHTCPINTARDVRAVIDAQTTDTDPHGVFSYLGWRPGHLPWNGSRTLESCFKGTNWKSSFTIAADPVSPGKS